MPPEGWLEDLLDGFLYGWDEAHQSYAHSIHDKLGRCVNCGKTLISERITLVKPKPVALWDLADINSTIKDIPKIEQFIYLPWVHASTMNAECTEVRTTAVIAEDYVKEMDSASYSRVG